jgi:hypothetical protein
MVIKDKAYYESFNRRMEYLHKTVDYHTHQANNWKDICRVTKGKRGYGWLNKFARYMNRRHVEKGTKIGVEALNECCNAMTELENCISKD